MTSPFVILSSPGMSDIARRVVELLKSKHDVVFPHYELEVEQFKNGEVLVHVPHTVRAQHVFFFHPMQYPTPNDACMTMFIANDALKRASVAGITMVIPYMPYLRQDRKHKPRVSISARMLADLIESNDQVKKVITADMHADQEQGFFSLPVDNLSSMPLFTEYLKAKLCDDMSKVIAVAPDFGAAVRTRRFAKNLDIPVVICEKSRPKPGEAELLTVIGEDVNGKTLVIYDDMIDTGGSVRNVVAALKHRGAKEVYVFATHGIFSGSAAESFAGAGVPVFCTDSIPRDNDYYTNNSSWLTLVSMDELLANAVYQSSLVGGSVSQLNN